MGLFYTVPNPTEALIITGGMTKRTPDTPFKVVVGRGVWTFPLIHKIDKFYTGAYNVQTEITAPSRDKVEVKVGANVVFTTGSNHDDIVRAASRFMGQNHEELKDIARNIFEGETRALVGQLSVEEIISDRMALAGDIITNATPKMQELGWKIDSFQINSITDDKGHIENLSQPELTRVRKQAEIANSEAETEIARARQESERQKSVYQKETEIQVSANRMETAKAVAEANQSGDLAKAVAGIELAKKERSLAEEQSSLRKIQYENDVVIPAQAEARKRTIEAEAEAEARERLSQADASNDNIALERMWIESLPQMVESYARGLSESNINFLGQSNDLNSMIGELFFSLNNLKNNLLVEDSTNNKKDEKNKEDNTSVNDNQDGSSRMIDM